MINMRTMPRYQTQIKTAAPGSCRAFACGRCRSGSPDHLNMEPELGIAAEVKEITVTHGDTL